MTRAAGSNEGAVVAVHSRWKWFLGLGAALWIFGIVASAKLFLATVGATYVLGVMMFVAATLQLVHALMVRRTGHVLFWAVSGLLYLLASTCVLLDPLFAARVITLFIAIGLGAAGLARVLIAAASSGTGRGWLLVSGLASILASTVIALGWPLNSFGSGSRDRSDAARRDAGSHRPGHACHLGLTWARKMAAVRPRS